LTLAIAVPAEASADRDFFRILDVEIANPVLGELPEQR
jgi:hypothetical protein